MSRRLLMHGVRLQPALWRRVEAYADERCVTVSEALRRLLSLGLDVADGRDRPAIEELQERLDRILRLVHRIGPPLVGLPHLLAYWATREESGVTADQVVEEFETNAELVWREMLARRRGDAGPDDEGSGEA